jgi:hypothetical protein
MVKLIWVTALLVSSLSLSVLSAGCKKAEASGIEVKLTTDPDPPKAGTIKVILTVKKDGEHFPLSNPDILLTDVLRAGLDRDVRLTQKEDHWFGLANVTRGRWRAEVMYYDQDRRDLRAYFIINVE